MKMEFLLSDKLVSKQCLYLQMQNVFSTTKRAITLWIVATFCCKTCHKKSQKRDKKPNSEGIQEQLKYN